MSKRRMRFVTWCRKDPNDETKIVYTFHTYDGKSMHFTSEDDLENPYMMLERIREAWIRKIERFPDHWEVELYEE